MTITNGYCTLTELKGRLWPVGMTPDSSDDTMLEQMITAVSRWIDQYTGRRFFSTATDEVRYYTAVRADELWPDDDVISVTSLQCDEDGDRTYERTWQTTDFDLEPANAGLDGRPYTYLAVTPEGNYSFPVGIRRGVKITGKFGYCILTSLPAIVKEACLIQAERIYKRKDSPLGVAGVGDLGIVRLKNELDPDVQQLLAPLVSWRL